MIIHKNEDLVYLTGASEVTETREPKKALVTVVESLQAKDNQVEADYHPETGSVRMLSTGSAKGLSTTRFNNDPKGHAMRTIRSRSIAKLLELSDCEISAPKVDELPYGYRVTFNQELHVRGRRTAVPVRAGHVHVHMKKDGTVFQIVNTLRHGDAPAALGKLVTRAQAIEAAKGELTNLLATAKLAEEEAQKKSGLDGKLGGVELHKAIANLDLAKLQDSGRLTQLKAETRPVIDKSSPTVQLVFSAHDDKLDPVYEVRLSVGEPRVYWGFLVHAKTGAVLHNRNLLHFASKKAVASGVQMKTLFRVPDPKKLIEEQIRDGVIEGLADPTVLKNDYIQVYVGGTKSKPVKAKADGTFNYGAKDPEFPAVAVFFAVTKQLDHLVKSGMMKKPSRPIPVYVQDPGVRDNAYFDPSDPQLRGGVGSGLKRGGLNVLIALDLSVMWHECGHYIVFLVTPGNDLPGSEGGAMHESSGDIMALVFGYLFRIWFAKELGETFGIKEMKSDRRVVGEYALPPDGIRIIRNNLKTPDDKTGEVHDDGRISGAAHADLLEALAVQAGDGKEEESCNKFLAIYMMALSLVPAHKVTFRDMLRCMITADQNLNGGANRKLIEDAHAAHGIKLANSAGGDTNTVVIVTTRRRRRRTA
ncbi:MAG: hypothetical protein IT343_00030 [Candidatus Melainabacteria bacterium]|jgi:Zn-dependent metalloprotease|nr:hypothetical protein [Candidatus Melainabacteria bacterium]